MNTKDTSTSMQVTTFNKLKVWGHNIIDEKTLQQSKVTASLPFIYKYMALMSDAHLGVGATVGSVIPTHKAIIPAAVGVDLGCGMVAVQTSLNASDLPDNLKPLREMIEIAVPHGMESNQRYKHSKGSFTEPTTIGLKMWKNRFVDTHAQIISKYPQANTKGIAAQLGTLGGGNHFIEICLDEQQKVWIMLHSGSRGVGNQIGRIFIGLAKKEMEKYHISLPDKDLAYLVEETELFNDYVTAVNWAQEYAQVNRDLMLSAVLDAMKISKLLPPFTLTQTAINCHHNYVQKENHYGENVWLTRKGAVSAREGQMGIIPGSMGAKSYIVRGKGNPESFCSCSHGAGRAMSRTEAKSSFTVADHIKATNGVECKKDESVLDETPAAYKDIDAVMEAQKDLVDIVHTLKQVLCVKG